MNNLNSFPGRFLEWILDTSPMRRIGSSAFASAILLSLVVVFWSFPSYDVALVLHEHDDNWDALFLQAQEPFTDHSWLYDSESHCAKLGTRFVPALLIRVLMVDTIIEGLLLQLVLMFFFYVLLIKVFRELLKDEHSALMFALPFCFVISGHVYVSDYRGIFDILALDLLLLAVLYRRSFIVLPILLLAYFTDERSLLASTAIILINLYIDHRTGSLRAILTGSISRNSLLIILSWPIYFIGRTMLQQHVGLRTTPVDVAYYFTENIPRVFHALSVGLEGFWIVLAAVVVSLYKQRSNLFIALIGTSYLLVFAIAMSVIDINRSMAYVLVLLILIMVILERSYERREVLSIVGWSALVSFVYVDFYPLIWQGYRMAFITKSLVPLEAWTN